MSLKNYFWADVYHNMKCEPLSTIQKCPNKMACKVSFMALMNWTNASFLTTLLKSREFL